MNRKILLESTPFMTSMEERERCYSFILSRTTHEPITKYQSKLVELHLLHHSLQSNNQNLANSLTTTSLDQQYY
jgi:hypothetical protein